jgi:hypothetical protein
MQHCSRLQGVNTQELIPHQAGKRKNKYVGKWCRGGEKHSWGNPCLTMTCLLNWSLSDYHPGSGSRTSSPCGLATLGSHARCLLLSSSCQHNSHISFHIHASVLCSLDMFFTNFRINSFCNMFHYWIKFILFYI